jgi:FlaA1/EpsC-like NDP-sugar epimerase
MPETDTPPWPDSHRFWRNKRVLVTGGHGFLGQDIGHRYTQIVTDKK